MRSRLAIELLPSEAVPLTCFQVLCPQSAVGISSTKSRPPFSRSRAESFISLLNISSEVGPFISVRVWLVWHLDPTGFRRHSSLVSPAICRSVASPQLPRSFYTRRSHKDSIPTPSGITTSTSRHSCRPASTRANLARSAPARLRIQ